MNSRRPFAFEAADDDPLSGIANLFDVAMVFAVALLAALISYMKLGELVTENEVTIVKNPGKPDMEIIRKEGKKIERYKATRNATGSKRGGRRIGVAYELDNGDIIYVPEE